MILKREPVEYMRFSISIINTYSFTNQRFILRIYDIICFYIVINLNQILMPNLAQLFDSKYLVFCLSFIYIPQILNKIDLVMKNCVSFKQPKITNLHIQPNSQKSFIFDQLALISPILSTYYFFPIKIYNMLKQSERLQKINNKYNSAYQQSNSIIYSNISNMIELKHMVLLNKAMHLILGPHENCEFPTQIIKQGEGILNKLRGLTSYPCLLANFLVQDPQGYNNVQKSNKIVSNYKKFVIIELTKQVPILDEVVWWHLLQFYYKCSQKMQKLIIQLISKHITIQSNYRNSYRPFITSVAQGYKWSMSSLAKMLHLVEALINKLKISSQNISQQEKLQHYGFICINLCNILKYSIKEWPNYTENIVMYIMKMIICVHLYIKSQEEYRGWCEFASKHLDNLLRELKLNGNNLSNLLELILFLCWRSTGQTVEFPYQCSQTSYFLQNLISMLLKGIHKKSLQYSQALEVISYFLIKFNHNHKILQDQADQIIISYYDHIINVQLQKSNHEIMSQVPSPEDYDLQLQNFLDENPYHLLSYCVEFKQQKLHQALVDKSQMKIITYFAYINFCKVSQEMVDIIVIYFNSLIHHSRVEQKNQTLICCLRFLYRFVVGDPNFNLIQICTAVLNLRTFYPMLQNLCDILLCKATPTIITCSQLNTLWDFAQIWIRNLQEHYMDVRAYSYFPIILIMETAQPYHFIQSLQADKFECIDFLCIFEQFLELITQEWRNTKNIRDISNENEFDLIEFFYKMCSVFVKYLQTIYKFVLEEQNLKIYQKIIQIINKILPHIFKNQLYSTDTAFIYVHSLIAKNDKEGTMEFINNMLTETFWRSYESNQITFYSCVLFGLVSYYKSLFNVNEIYRKYKDILDRNEEVKNYEEKQFNELKEQIAEFETLFNNEPSSHFPQNYQSSNEYEQRNKNRKIFLVPEEKYL